MLYHTVTIGPSETGFTSAFLKALELASAQSSDVVLVVHTIKMLKGGVFESVLGRERVAAFAKHRLLTFDGVTVHLETEQIRSGHHKAVFFAPFVSSKLLAKVLSDIRVADVVYVPWAQEELDSYAAEHPDSVQL